MIEPTISKLRDAAEFINQRLMPSKMPKPSVAIVLGSGLGQFASTMKNGPLAASVAYGEIPHFKTSTVDGHKGELIYSLVDQKIPVLLLNGRLHCYEGYDAHDVVFPIRTSFLLGVTKFILTNASGAIGDNFEPGQLMAINDHINLTGNSPLIGKNIAELGPRFVDMTVSYDREFIALAKKAAAKALITMHEGIYAGLIGPCYETPAEISMLKRMGAHAVGMSTVFETIAARHMGAKVLAISCLTNKAAGLSEKKISHQEVIDINARVGDKLAMILTEVVKEIG